MLLTVQVYDVKAKAIDTSVIEAANESVKQCLVQSRGPMATPSHKQLYSRKVADLSPWITVE